MSPFSDKDCAHMARALRLAALGQYTAHPNPIVGCVLVADGEIVGEGCHMRTGDAHAETNALAEAGDRARGATAYVTLEPCSHEGRTPPCTDALIAAGIAKVVVAMLDPYSGVTGRGIGLLKAAGIELSTGLMESVATEQNAGYLSRVVRKRPIVRLKLASSFDGAIAMSTGESQWITSPEARADVQRMRAKSGAVLTGIASVLADDPSLNVRSEGLAESGLQPLRVVLDSTLRMPLTAAMLALPGSTLVCCTGDQPNEKGMNALRNAGAEVKSFTQTGRSVDAAAVFEELAVRGVNNVLVEAGPTLAGSLLENGLVDELVIYQAPHIMGSNTMRLVSTPSWLSLADKMELNITDVRRIGADTRTTAKADRQN